MSGAMAGLQVTGISQFVTARTVKVRQQLASEQNGPSAVDFDSNNWSLP
ncbi:MAG TPA: hypothetical protein VGJ91_21750 [Polyangiaceae bacterium]